MISIETEALIAAPPERVWALLTGFAGYARWNPYIVRVEGAAVAGSDIIVHSVPIEGRPPMVAAVRVVSADYPAMRWDGGLPDRARFRGDHWWVLDAADDGARLRHFEHFTGTDAPAILAAHGERIRANFHIFNAALKAEAERT